MANSNPYESPADSSSSTTKEHGSQGPFGAWPGRLMWFGAFLGMFAGYLMSKGPAVNDAQMYFRLGLAVVGGIVALVGLVWHQFSSKKRS